MNTLYKTCAAACVLTAAFAFLTPQPLRAQSFPDLIQQLGIEQLARDYLRPGVDAIGYTINSGYAHTARVDTAFHLWFGMKGITTYIPSDRRQFTAPLPGALTAAGYPATVSTASIVGGAGTVLRSSDPSQPDIVLPDGADLSRTYLILPQLHVGPILGTDIILRGLPPVTYDTDVGKVSFYGAALKHELTHYFESPVQVALLAGYQHFDMTDAVAGNSMSGLLLLSRDFGALTAFGGIGYESYDITVSYTYRPEDPTASPEDITLDFLRRNLRLSFGGSLTLLSFLDLTAEYSIGELDNLTLGIGFSF